MNFRKNNPLNVRFLANIVSVLVILQVSAQSHYAGIDSLINEGLELESEGENREAINVFEMALSTLKLLEYRDREVSEKALIVYYHLAFNCYRLKEFSMSQVFIDEGLDYGKKHLAGLNQNIANLLRVQGTLYFLDGKLDSAIVTFKKGLNLLEELNVEYHLDVALLLNNLSVVEGQFGDYSKKKRTDIKQLKVLNMMYPDSIYYRLCRCYNGLSIDYGFLRDLDSLLHFSNKAKDCYLQLRDTSHYLAMQNNIGFAYLEAGNLDRASEVFNHLRLETKLRKDSITLSLSYFNLGEIYYQKRDYYLASEYHRESLRIRRQLQGLHPIDLPNSFHNLGRALYKLDDPSCLEYYLHALEIRKRVFYPDHPDITMSHSAILNYYIYIEENSDSIDYYASLTLSGFNRTKNMEGLSFMYSSLADFQERHGGVKMALQYRRLALQKIKELYGLDHPQTRRRTNELAELFANLHQYDSARFYLDEVFLNLDPDWNSGKEYDLDSMPDPFGLFEALLLQANLKKIESGDKLGMDELNMILEIYDQSIQVIEAIRGYYNYAEMKLNVIAASKKVFELAIQISLKLYDLMGREEFLERAYVYCAQGKSIYLNELLDKKHWWNDALIPEDLSKFRSNLLFKVDYFSAEIEKEKSAENPDSLKLTSLDMRLLRTREQLDSLNLILEEQYPDFISLRSNKVIALDQLQQFLRKSESSLLESFWGDSILTIFYLDGRNIKVHNIPSSDSLQRKITSYVDLVETRPLVLNEKGEALFKFQEFVKRSNSLYKMLVEPVLGGERSSRLFIVADELLHKLPFESLVSKHSGNVRHYHQLAFLGLERDISYAFSSVDVDHNLEGKMPTIDYLGFAPSYFPVSIGNSSMLIEDGYASERARLQALEFSEREVLEVAEIMKGEALTGLRVNKEHFLDAAHTAGILHFSGHAWTDHNHPMLSELSFGNTEALFAYELAHLPLQADLTVITACQSGSGKLSRGEGLFGFARSLRIAGSPNLVVSRWRADDRSTYQLATQFFRILKQGSGKSNALRLAREHYIRQIEDPLMAHPYYWSHLVLYGTHDELNLKNSIAAFWIIFPLVLLLIIWMVTGLKS